MRTSTGILALALPLLALGPARASAQREASIALGARVRVMMTGRQAEVGRLTSLEADRLDIVTDDGAERVLARAQITAIDVSMGRRRHLLAGLGYGVLVGGVGGGIYGAATFDPTPCAFICLAPDTRAGNAALGAVVFGALGGVVGLAIGGLHTTEHWQRVMTDGGRIGLAPMRGGVGAVLRF